MSCPLCVYDLEKQLHKLDGVDTVATDLEHGRIRIGMHEGKALDQPQVQQAVRDAGFTLRDFAPVAAQTQQCPSSFAVSCWPRSAERRGGKEDGSRRSARRWPCQSCEKSEETTQKHIQ